MFHCPLGSHSLSLLPSQVFCPAAHTGPPEGAEALGEAGTCPCLHCTSTMHPLESVTFSLYPLLMQSEYHAGGLSTNCGHGTGVGCCWYGCGVGYPCWGGWGYCCWGYCCP